MYEKHFGLKSGPFRMTTDLDHFFPSAQHSEALAALTFGVEQYRGLMTLIGEVGTGKTTLIHALLRDLGPTTCSVLITHTTINREELYCSILDKLYTARLPGWGANPIVAQERDSAPFSRLSSLSRGELIIGLHRVVAAEYLAQRRPMLLIVDEAQHLTAEVLEEIRLLTNLEGPNCKLIQVILSGQPELEHQLLRPELRQLRQRIAAAARLRPLSREETADYIRHRLEESGYQGRDLFNRAALQLIWAASEGSPRTINVLCDYALVNAFALGMTRVDETVVREAVHDALSVHARIHLIQKPLPYVVSNVDPVSIQDSPKRALGLTGKDGV